MLLIDDVLRARLRTVGVEEYRMTLECGTYYVIHVESLEAQTLQAWRRAQTGCSMMSAALATNEVGSLYIETIVRSIDQHTQRHGHLTLKMVSVMT